MQIARLLAVLTSSVLLSVVPPVFATPLTLRASAPAHYTVKHGDTLWSISGRFLKNPWQWPRLWRMNREEIHNPHWIYPGDVLTLDRSGTTPRLVLRHPGRLPVVHLSPQMHAWPLHQGAIGAVSLAGLRPYLTRSLVLDQGQLPGLPVVLAGADPHLLLGPGSRLYVSGLAAPAGSEWAIYHPGAMLVDPPGRRPLGQLALYAGSARVVRSGEPATVEIINADREVEPGDRLLPMTAAVLRAYPPHAPQQPLAAQVIRIMGGLSEAGEHQLVILNRGRLEGMAAGQVFNVQHPAPLIAAVDRAGRHVLVNPGNRRVGLLYILKSFTHSAIALVTESETPVQPGDLAQATQDTDD